MPVCACTGFRSFAGGECKRRVLNLRHPVECRAVAPPKETVQPPSAESMPRSAPVNIDDVRRPVAADMDQLVENLTSVVGERHPMLMAAAQQIFGAGGKKLRPMLVFLVSRATCKHTGRCVCRTCFCSSRVSPRAQFSTASQCGQWRNVAHAAQGNNRQAQASR
jgi:hypothetical protein